MANAYVLVDDAAKEQIRAISFLGKLTQSLCHSGYKVDRVFRGQEGAVIQPLLCSAHEPGPESCRLMCREVHEAEVRIIERRSREKCVWTPALRHVCNCLTLSTSPQRLTMCRESEHHLCSPGSAVNPVGRVEEKPAGREELGKTQGLIIRVANSEMGDESINLKSPLFYQFAPTSRCTCQTWLTNVKASRRRRTQARRLHMAEERASTYSFIQRQVRMSTVFLITTFHLILSLLLSFIEYWY